MNSARVTVRLTAAEVAMLDELRISETGSRNRSEFLRFLIRRDWNRRRHRTSVVKDSTVSSEFRKGRPKRSARKCEAKSGIEVDRAVEVA
jgi:Arc/MetJ-type ribon-helix-helix transcriptional regulator